MNGIAAFEGTTPVLLYNECGDKIHYFPFRHLGNDLSAGELLVRFQSILENELGQVEKRSLEKIEKTEAVGQSHWVRELLTAKNYKLERRTNEIYFGASGAIEQVILALVGAFSYEALKLISMKLYAAMNEEAAENNNSKQEDAETRSKIRAALIENYSVAPTTIVKTLQCKDREEWLVIMPAHSKVQVVVASHGMMFFMPVDGAVSRLGDS